MQVHKVLGPQCRGTLTTLWSLRGSDGSEGEDTSSSIYHSYHMANPGLLSGEVHWRTLTPQRITARTGRSPGFDS